MSFRRPVHWVESVFLKLNGVEHVVILANVKIVDTLRSVQRSNGRLYPDTCCVHNSAWA